MMFDCVCNGQPVSLKIEIRTLSEAAPGVAAFVKPSTVHTMTAGVDAGAAADDRLSSRTPDDEVKAATTVAGDGLMLEQEGAAAVALKLEKYNPETDITLIEIAFSVAGAMNDIVKIT